MAVQKEAQSIKKLTPPPSSGEHRRRKNTACKRDRQHLSTCCSGLTQASAVGARAAHRPVSRTAWRWRSRRLKRHAQTRPARPEKPPGEDSIDVSKSKMKYRMARPQLAPGNDACLRRAI